jgi:hypothetical protein
MRRQVKGLGRSAHKRSIGAGCAAMLAALPTYEARLARMRQ